MSTERDELTRIIKTPEDFDGGPASCGPNDVYAARTADAILAAGYRKPRVITTAKELNALPMQSVIRDAEDYVWERFGGDPTSWDCCGVPDWESHLINLPATVLWEPK